MSCHLLSSPFLFSPVEHDCHRAVLYWVVIFRSQFRQNLHVAWRLNDCSTTIQSVIITATFLCYCFLISCTNLLIENKSNFSSAFHPPVELLLAVHGVVHCSYVSYPASTTPISDFCAFAACLFLLTCRSRTTDPRPSPSPSPMLLGNALIVSKSKWLSTRVWVEHLIYLKAGRKNSSASIIDESYAADYIHIQVLIHLCLWWDDSHTDQLKEAGRIHVLVLIHLCL